ncbi:MAG: hypothetical protein ABIV21_03180, partial [Pyrinomonadaceae bacterium]
MTKFIRNGFKIAFVATLLSLPTLAQAVKRAPFDVTKYVMDVLLVPNERKMNATVDVTFTPLEDTRSVSFELNGSLKVDSITRVGAVSPLPLVTTPSRRAVST